MLPPFLKIQNARCTLDADLLDHIKDIEVVDNLLDQYNNQG